MSEDRLTASSEALANTTCRSRILQKVKIFKTVEDELNALEAEMNAWIESSGARIISITGNIAPQSMVAMDSKSFGASDVLIIVLYEEGKG